MVHLHTQSLEHLRQFFFLLTRVYKRSYHVQQVGDSDNVLRSPCLHDAVGHSFGILQLAVKAENRGQPFGVVFVYHASRVKVVVAVHAHVENAVAVSERETALSVVEVMERHAEVGEDAVGRQRIVETKEITQVSEVSMHKREPVVVNPVCISVHVLVETEQPTIRSETRHNGARVTSSSECHVDVCAVVLYVEPLDCFQRQCRDMIHR